MTVQELIDRLSELDPTARVRIATNPAWPIAHIVEAVTQLGSDNDDDDIDREASIEDDAPTPIVWLAAGGMPWSESPYAPRAAWEGIV